MIQGPRSGREGSAKRSRKTKFGPTFYVFYWILRHAEFKNSKKFKNHYCILAWASRCVKEGKKKERDCGLFIWKATLNQNKSIKNLNFFYSEREVRKELQTRWLNSNFSKYNSRSLNIIIWRVSNRKGEDTVLSVLRSCAIVKSKIKSDLHSMGIEIDISGAGMGLMSLGANERFVQSKTAHVLSLTDTNRSNSIWS